MTRFEWTLSALALGAAMIGISPAFASDMFPGYVGAWVGEGIIAWKSDGSKERMKCTATYGETTAGDQLKLRFDCKSDHYVFILDGNIEAAGNGQLSGQWSERSRNIGGPVIGQVKGDRIRLRIESSAFGANILMGVKNDKQQIAIKFSGAGEEADTEIFLKKAK